MPAAPGASRPTRIQPKPSGSAPARPKMASPRPSATQRKASSAVKKPVGKASPQPQRSHQRAQHPRSSPKSGNLSPRAHAKATAGRILLSTPHHHRSAQKPQHVHRHMTSGKHGASSKPVYVVCNRKHYDDGIYARCQRVLRRFVKWNR